MKPKSAEANFGFRIKITPYVWTAVIWADFFTNWGINPHLKRSNAQKPFLPTVNGPSDTHLLQQARQGDQQAFRLLVERYQGQVAATVIGMLGAGEEAEDVGQEVFVRFFRALDHFREESALGTYLTRIAINRCLTILDKRKRRGWMGRLTGDKAGWQVSDPDQAEAHGDNRDWVQAGLQRLDPRFRAVLVLRLMEGYSTKETAHILDIREGTVLSRLARGQEKLREILLQLEAPHFPATPQS